LVWFDGLRARDEITSVTDFNRVDRRFFSTLLLLWVRDLKRNAAIRHYIEHLGITVKKLN
jgi:hypothetical protein